jgi:hypothetical protein
MASILTWAPTAGKGKREGVGPSGTESGVPAPNCTKVNKTHRIQLAQTGVQCLQFLTPAPAAAPAAVAVCDETHLRAALSGGGAVTSACDGYIMLAKPIVISSSTTIDGSGQSVTLAGNAGALLDGRGVGGGLQLRDTTGSRVLRNRITGNQAGMIGGSHGGGLVLDRLEGATAQAVVDGNVISDNWAAGDPEATASEGGGSVLWMEDGFTFINNVVAGNHADDVGGFAIADLPDGAEVVNNTVAGNDDAGLAVSGSAITLTNNIVVSQTVGVEVDAGAKATLSYTLWNGNVANTGGGGVIDETHPVTGDPAFVKPAAGDFRLTIGSPARDAGDPAGVPPAPDHDAGGVTRPQGAAVDIGAYEWKGFWQRLPVVLRPLPARVGWAIGTNADGAAVIVHTVDGGQNWKAQGNPALWTGMGGNDISAVDDLTAWAALGSAAGADSGAILHTTDGGAVWTVVPQSARQIADVNRIDALGSADVWIAAPDDTKTGNSYIIHTQDNGLTWRLELLPGVPAVDYGPMTVNALSPLTVWTAPNGSSDLYRTLDGGDDWVKVATVPGMGDFDDLCTAGADAVWALQTLGENSGAIWRVHVAADDSVDSRMFKPASTAFSYEGVTCLDERTVWAVGWNALHTAGLPLGVIVVTVDGGEQWVQGSAPADIEYLKVSFVGARR